VKARARLRAAQHQLGVQQRGGQVGAMRRSCRRPLGGCRLQHTALQTLMESGPAPLTIHLIEKAAAFKEILCLKNNK
jgi:hypothetical protein